MTDTSPNNQGSAPRSRPLFNWSPNKDTAFALYTLLLIWLLYWAGNTLVYTITGTPRPDGELVWWASFLRFLLFIMIGTIFLGVYFPTRYIAVGRGGKLEDLGIRRDNLPFALGLSFVVTVAVLAGLAGQGMLALAPADLPGHLFLGLATFWEPFFVHAWLQMRFEKAFGLGPAILLAAGSYALYHVGSYGLDHLAVTAAFGLAMAVLFAITRNFFSIWPLAWMLSGVIGPTGEVSVPPVGEIILIAFLLALQLFALDWVAKEGRLYGPKDKGHTAAL